MKRISRLIDRILGFLDKLLKTSVLTLGVSFSSTLFFFQIRLGVLAFFIYDYFLDYDFTKGFRLAVEGNTTNPNLETEDYRSAYWAGVVFLVLPLVIHVVLALYQTWRYLSVNAVWKDYEYDTSKCCFQTIVPKGNWRKRLCSWQYPVLSETLAAAVARQLVTHLGRYSVLS